MASGDAVVQILDIMQPTTVFATPDFRLGGSTPAEAVAVFDFDGTADEYLDIKVQLKGYAGGGLTFTLVWMATSATTGNVRWGLAVRRLDDDTEDVDTAQTYDFNSVDATTASATGECAYDTITFTSGADMDSWAEGEVAILRLRREASHANDTMNATDAELVALVGRET